MQECVFLKTLAHIVLVPSGLLVDLGFCESKDLYISSSETFIEGSALLGAKAPGIPSAYGEWDGGFVALLYRG